jgi:hypothetical protein
LILFYVFAPPLRSRSTSAQSASKGDGEIRAHVGKEAAIGELGLADAARIETA